MDMNGNLKRVITRMDARDYQDSLDSADTKANEITALGWSHVGQLMVFSESGDISHVVDSFLKKPVSNENVNYDQLRQLIDLLEAVQGAT